MKYALDNGIIDLSSIQQNIEMKKREKILQEHPQSIWFGKDGYWHTYITVNEKRKAVKRKKKEDLENIIIDNYKDGDQYRFKHRYSIWIERQEKCGRSGNTIYKYHADYKRFFADTDFEKRDVRYINEEIIMEHLTEVLKNKKIPYKALKGAFGYLNGVFEKCKVDRIIKENPCDYVDLLILKKLCTEPKKKTGKERTVSSEEKVVLLRKFRDRPTVLKFAIEFSFYSGMRAGELSGLRWEDVDFQNNTIFIHSSEKLNRMTGEYTVEGTKNGKERTIPLTEEMRKVLSMTYEFEKENDWVTEFVFSNAKGRVHADRISNASTKNTSTHEFTCQKGVHAFRRTLNSNMRCNGVSATVAAAILGHSEKVNENNYTYDMSNMEAKKSCIEQAGAF